MTIALARPARLEGRYHSSAEVLDGIDLTGRRAVVTGGADGLGYATVTAMKRAGADVVIGARPGAKLDAAAAALAIGPGGKVLALSLDLADLSSIAIFAQALTALPRPIDLFVANAGVIGPLARSAIGVETN